MYDRTRNDQLKTGLSNSCQSVDIPEYLDRKYWWAYLHPAGVRFFDQAWVVRSILFGNYNHLKSKVVSAIDSRNSDVLQIAAVYGDISQEIARKIQPNGSLHIIDVAPIQLANLQTKMAYYENFYLYHRDSTDLGFPSNSFDTVLLFFLLHEQPDLVKSATLAEACRVLKPGGKLIIIDYHKPVNWHPCKWVLMPVLRLLEPYALSLWKQPLIRFLPKQQPLAHVNICYHFGRLYQEVVVYLP
ncbi:methyltransferase domain-containing protein [Endozoicomonas sp. SM1973]|uniref:Methyltransferase domain-containing protein n=1 Tax=Spartinivicinus marinus TaxID=2994442 RepID=A0A853IA46_9GAMM|nr:rhodoquinone biosynthesis methyltransferase RquA [Spartinivicinus marinus]MCX4029802.1 rhodoquinone biosynthesis methyltransferase RquA [Spartinivicinus marinus]NYZ67528.1 methyltransferase domain-containing protein [Spartinivicinus marinus]